MEKEEQINISKLINNISDEDIWNFLDTCVEDTFDISSASNETSKLNDTYCKHCTTYNMIIDDNKSKYTCNNCGIEDIEIFDTRPEWNNYEDNIQTSGRCGAATNLFLPKSSLGTIIAGKGYSRIRLLQNWNHMPYKERSLSNILYHIERSLKKYKITKAIIDNAKILYKNISDLKHISGPNKDKYIITRGINRYGIIAACAYYGAKLQGHIRTIKEIAEIFNLKIPQLTRGCRKFLNLLNNKEIIANIKSSQPYEFINRFSYKLNLNSEQLQHAINISKNIIKLDIASDHQPISLAAASLLLAINVFNININKKLISEIFDISEVTIIKTYKNIHQYKKIIINNNLTDIVYNKIQEKIANNTISMSPEIKCSQDNFHKLFLPYNTHNLFNKNTLITPYTFTNTEKNNIKLPRGRPRKIVI